MLSPSALWRSNVPPQPRVSSSGWAEIARIFKHLLIWHYFVTQLRTNFHLGKNFCNSRARFSVAVPVWRTSYTTQKNFVLERSSASLPHLPGVDLDPQDIGSAFAQILPWTHQDSRNFKESGFGDERRGVADHRRTSPIERHESPARQIVKYF